MKRLSFFLALIICFSMCACNPGVAEAPPAAVDVKITAGGIETGMTVRDVFVEVAIDGQPVACEVELTCFTADGYYVMDSGETMPEDFFGRLDVYYSLPKGVDLDSANITMECDGGEYDGTGSTGNDAQGCVVAWSHAIYGTEPAVPEEPEEPEEPIAPKVYIKAGKIETGMTAGDVFVEVTIDGQPVACKVELTCFTQDGYYVMDSAEATPDNFFGRLDVYYSLPKDVELDNVDVVMECDGGEYDGTGSIGNDAQGCVVAWSHAIYGTEPTFEPTPAPTAPPAPAPTPTPVPAPTPEHIHSWTEDPSRGGPVGCDFDGYKTFVCSCGETMRETIPATGHDMRETITEPGCTSVGYKTAVCKLCGESLISELPPAGHKWSGWMYENGRLHKRSCGSCGAEEEANHNVPSGTVRCSGCGQDIVN